MQKFIYEPSHDPREFIRGIQQILISDSKRIGFLCGAGTSMASPLMNSQGEIEYSVSADGRKWPRPMIPGVLEMTSIILEKIQDEKFKKGLESIREELCEGILDEKARDKVFMVENILSSIDQKIRVVGKDQLCGLTKSELSILRAMILEEIRKLVSIHNNDSIKLNNDHLIHNDFARYIKYASRKFPIEIFTTNYDYLFEHSLEHNFISYFDGFVGGFNPFFDPISVESEHAVPSWTKLWKLHGSLGWKYDEDDKRIVRSRTSNDDSIVIYPSLLKYDDSRKQPYASYLDRLARFIKSEDSVLFVCGYSFGDQHINETIMNALAQARSSTIIALLYDKDLNSKSHAVELAKRSKKMMLCANRSAYIGGIYADWKLKREPSSEDFDAIDQYFDLNAPTPKHEQGQGDELSDLKGELNLVDFSSFVRFLIGLSYPTEIPND